jgi:hypothetical protein
MQALKKKMGSVDAATIALLRQLSETDYLIDAIEERDSSFAENIWKLVQERTTLDEAWIPAIFGEK